MNWDQCRLQTKEIRKPYYLKFDEESVRSVTRVSPIKRSLRNSRDWQSLYRSASLGRVRNLKRSNNTQTVEIEERDGDDPSQAHTIRESFTQKMMEARKSDLRYSTSNLKDAKESKIPKESFIDTIINYDEDAGDLNIANIVKIGDRVITKEWDWGQELKEQEGKKLTLYQTFDRQLQDIQGEDGRARSTGRSPATWKDAFDKTK